MTLVSKYSTRNIVEFIVHVDNWESICDCLKRKNNLHYEHGAWIDNMHEIKNFEIVLIWMDSQNCLWSWKYPHQGHMRWQPDVLLTNMTHQCVLSVIILLFYICQHNILKACVIVYKEREFSLFSFTTLTCDTETWIDKSVYFTIAAWMRQFLIRSKDQNCWWSWKCPKNRATYIS